ncbi:MULTISPECIES: hypothetical protein [unclassified Rhizobium]|uniref:hypothetical protein n=1 Tax=unclassified Rhizobium TaxID=2613769 RepID=UPI00104C814A|nr:MULTISPECIES: hypothetical protein [unclassified Rhizobium]MBB3399645.1 hypothetical protein [Rhizobium sp. BK060]TCM75276.1 hypothetical protein EV291_11410 [Rhizobium sp. BK068]
MREGLGAGTSELESYKDLLVNKNTITLRTDANSGDTISISARQATYLGSFRTTANGVATDTASQRLLFNAWNPIARRLFKANPADYAYSDRRGIVVEIEQDQSFSKRSDADLNHEHKKALPSICACEISLHSGRSVACPLEGIDVALVPPTRIAIIPPIVVETAKSSMAKSAKGMICTFSKTIVVLGDIPVVVSEVVATQGAAVTTSSMTSAVAVGHGRSGGDDRRDRKG